MENRANSLADTPLPDSEGSGFAQYLKNNSLKLSGYLNLVGDVGLLLDGLKIGAKDKDAKPDTLRVAGASLYTLGGLNLIRYGDAAQKHQMLTMSNKIADFIEAETGELPTNSQLFSIRNTKTDDSAMGKIDNVLSHKPAEKTLALYTAGAAAMLADGGYKAYHGGEIGDAYYGASSLTCKLISWMVPEQSKDQATENKENKNVIDWVKEKPLRVFGYGSMISELLLAREAYVKFKEGDIGKAGYMWKAFSSLSYLAADGLVAISNKDEHNADYQCSAKERAELKALAEDALNYYPTEKRDGLRAQIDAIINNQTPEPVEKKGQAKEQDDTQQQQSWVTRIQSQEPQLAAIGA